MSSVLRLRPYRDSDFEAFVRAQSHAFAVLAKSSYSASELAALADSRHSPERRAEMLQIDEWVAESDGRIVGAAGQWPEPSAEQTARIRRVFVDPEHAGTGLGRRLVEDAEARAGRAGNLRLVVCASLNAVPFYEQLGYSRDRPEVRDYAGTRVPFHWMQKALGRRL